MPPPGIGREISSSKKGNQSAIGTLVERSTNYTMLVHLPDGYTAEKTRDALTAKIKTLPKALRTTLTWDQGVEMREWKRVVIDASIQIFFCDPHSPWQRGVNENTNGLLDWSPKAATCRSTPRKTSTGSPRNSTTDPAND